MCYSDGQIYNNNNNDIGMLLAKQYVDVSQISDVPSLQFLGLDWWNKCWQSILRVC